MPERSPWYLKQSPLGAAYAHFANVASHKTVLDSKTQELIRLAVASVVRCKHCTEQHVKDALAAGATKAEITEAILLSSLQAAGTQLNWHKEFFEENIAEQGS